MKPQLLKVSTNVAGSFSVRRDVVPYVNNKWHYHPEIELIHFKKGHGTQFIGDHIQSFSSGDVLLVGAGLPHYWRFDDGYFNEAKDVSADVRVAHFREDFWGTQFLELPENKPIKKLLQKARLGLAVKGQARQLVADLLEEMLLAEGSKRIILLLQALAAISSASELSVLSSLGFTGTGREGENERINLIYEYAIENFRKPVQIDEIAAVAHISPNSFCRYFKSRTGKTFSDFMIEIRVGQACRLLIEDTISVKEVCYLSGFNNFASFHKYFRLKTGKSPLGYRKQFYRQQESAAALPV